MEKYESTCHDEKLSRNESGSSSEIEQSNLKIIKKYIYTFSLPITSEQRYKQGGNFENTMELFYFGGSRGRFQEFIY